MFMMFIEHLLTQGSGARGWVLDPWKITLNQEPQIQANFEFKNQGTNPIFSLNINKVPN